MVSRCLCLLTLLLALPAGEGPSVVFLGDSITAGYGLSAEQAYPALVATALGEAWRVVNAGVSGDTSAGGLRRTDWLLKGRPRVVVIALGGNDGLRGLPVAQLETNLRSIVTKVRAAKATPLLIGMRMPRNLGPAYVTAFEAVYPRLAKELDAPLLPFLLDGVAMEPSLNQPDLVHPNAKGQQVIAVKVTAWLKPLLP